MNKDSLVTHQLTASEWTKTSRMINQRYQIKLLEKIEAGELFFSKRIEKTYNISKRILLKKIAGIGTIISNDNLLCSIADDFILEPGIVDAGTGPDLDNRGFVFVFYSKFENAEKIEKKIIDAFKEYEMKSVGVKISWGIMSQGDIRFIDVHNSLNETVYSDAYPYISPEIDTYINNYFNSDSPVLIIKGKPGTGKTRFLRYIMQKIAERKKDDANVLYSMDENIFGHDMFYLRFLTDGYDAMILEDIDLNLKARSSGNTMMHKLLGGADGFIRNQKKKIILTTNITNIRDIDEALLREGRCFDCLETRNLNPFEANILLKKINSKARVDVLNLSQNLSVATIYKIANDEQIAEMVFWQSDL